jgi:hypothetical protein
MLKSRFRHRWHLFTHHAAGRPHGLDHSVQHAEKNALKVEFTHSLTPVLPALLGRVRHKFDRSARPGFIAAHLQQDAMLQKSVMQNPGLRVPGSSMVDLPAASKTWPQASGNTG